MKPHFTIRVSREFQERIKAAALAEEMTVTAYIIDALKARMRKRREIISSTARSGNDDTQDSS